MKKKNINSMLLVGGLTGIYFLRKLMLNNSYSLMNKVVVITGGSRGLGLVTGRTFMKEGAHVVVLARDGEELERAKQDLMMYGEGKVEAIKCDVRNKEEVERVFKKIYDEFGNVDVLVNNAGVIKVGPLDSMSDADYAEAMETHFWGPLHTINAVLPRMKEQGQGRIVNISSIGGKIAVPHLAPYSASKFALVGLSNAMRTELSQYGISVTTVLPGPMRTGSHYNAMFKGDNQKEFAWFGIASSLPLASVDADIAGKLIVDGTKQGAAQVVITEPFRAAMIANEVAPGVVASVLKAANMLLPKSDPLNAKEKIAHKGWDSRSAIAPSILTRLNDKESLENNEVKSVEQAQMLVKE